jgi:uncharacterized protein (TIGR02118 family)
MLKFLVGIYKRPGMSGEEFRRRLTELHGPLADRLTGRRRYVRHHVRADPKRNSPGWNAVIELFFDDWAAMEVAWASPEGAASDSDFPAFAELTRTTWPVADEIMVLE